MAPSAVTQRLLLIRHAAAEDRDARRWPDDARRPLTPRRTTGLVLCPPERSTAQDHHQLAQLTQQSAELAEAVALAQDFASLVRGASHPRSNPG